MFGDWCLVFCLTKLNPIFKKPQRSRSQEEDHVYNKLRRGFVYFVPFVLWFVYVNNFLMLFREAEKKYFKIALVSENVTLSNPGI